MNCPMLICWYADIIVQYVDNSESSKALHIELKEESPWLQHFASSVHRTLEIHFPSLFSSPVLLCCLFFPRAVTRFPFCQDCTAFYKIMEGEWMKLMAFINMDRNRLKEYEFTCRDGLLGSLEMTLEMVECNLCSIIWLKGTTWCIGNSDARHRRW